MTVLDRNGRKFLIEMTEYLQKFYMLCLDKSSLYDDPKSSDIYHRTNSADPDQTTHREV